MAGATATAQTQPAHSKSWSPPKRANDVDAHIAQRLKAARRSRGLSQTAAAEVVGVTFQQFQKYEKGANRISCGSLAKLADAFKLPVGWFFEGAVGQHKAELDIGTALVAEPHGAELARLFLGIEDRGSRKALLDVAAALSKAEGTR